MSAITTTTRSAITTFGQDIQEGLEQSPKQLSSKYFYDAKGDRLFQQIMAMPEYYLTDCELEIFTNSKKEILQAIGNGSFDFIELGAGDGSKTKILLQYFLEQNANFQYIPIDISRNALSLLESDLNCCLPNLKIKAIQGDYFKALEQHDHLSTTLNVVLFPGANIGNFHPNEAKEFLQQIYQRLSKGDLLLIGFDLKKNPAVILDAYNDKAGITRDFNLNLLHRINRELNANFKIENFKHWETYNPITGATESFIISKKDQQVTIDTIGKTFNFKAWEAISVEVSQKYSIQDINSMAKDIGFTVEQHFFDHKNYFVDSLWRK